LPLIYRALTTAVRTKTISWYSAVVLTVWCSGHTSGTRFLYVTASIMGNENLIITLRLLWALSGSDEKRLLLRHACLSVRNTAADAGVIVKFYVGDFLLNSV